VARNLYRKVFLASRILNLRSRIVRLTPRGPGQFLAMYIVQHDTMAQPGLADGVLHACTDESRQVGESGLLQAPG
jgi:hypothetical protein